MRHRNRHHPLCCFGALIVALFIFPLPVEARLNTSCTSLLNDFVEKRNDLVPVYTNNKKDASNSGFEINIGSKIEDIFGAVICDRYGELRELYITYRYNPPDLPMVPSPPDVEAAYQDAQRERRAKEILIFRDAAATFLAAFVGEDWSLSLSRIKSAGGLPWRNAESAVAEDKFETVKAVRPLNSLYRFEVSVSDPFMSLRIAKAGVP